MAWRMNFPTSGIQNVVCHGDSITNGSYNMTNADYYYPTVLQKLFDGSRFNLAGTNVCPDPTFANAGSWSAASGATVSRNNCTCTTSSTNVVPRAITTAMQSCDPTKYVIVEADIDSANWAANSSGGTGNGFGVRVQWSSDGSTFPNQTFYLWNLIANGPRHRRLVIAPSSIPAGTKYLKAGPYCSVKNTDPVSTAVFTNFALSQSSSQVTVYNTGVVGDTSAQGLSRFSTDVLSKNPTHVVMMFGTNDVRNGVDMNTWLTNLKSMVDDTRQAGAVPVLMTIPPLASSQANYTVVPTWNQQLQTSAAGWGVSLVDNFTEFTNIGGPSPGVYEIADGRHPSAYGYRLIARNVFRTLTGYTR